MENRDLAHVREKCIHSKRETPLNKSVMYIFIIFLDFSGYNRGGVKRKASSCDERV